MKMLKSPNSNNNDDDDDDDDNNNNNNNNNNNCNSTHSYKRKTWFGIPSYIITPWVDALN